MFIKTLTARDQSSVPFSTPFESRSSNILPLMSTPAAEAGSNVLVKVQVAESKAVSCSSLPVKLPPLQLRSVWVY